MTKPVNQAVYRPKTEGFSGDIKPVVRPWAEPPTRASCGLFAQGSESTPPSTIARLLSPRFSCPARFGRPRPPSRSGPLTPSLSPISRTLFAGRTLHHDGDGGDHHRPTRIVDSGRDVATEESKLRCPSRLVDRDHQLAIAEAFRTAVCGQDRPDNGLPIAKDRDHQFRRPEPQVSSHRTQGIANRTNIPRVIHRRPAFPSHLMFSSAKLSTVSTELPTDTGEMSGWGPVEDSVPVRSTSTTASTVTPAGAPMAVARTAWPAGR